MRVERIMQIENHHEMMDWDSESQLIDNELFGKAITANKHIYVAGDKVSWKRSSTGKSLIPVVKDMHFKGAKKYMIVRKLLDICEITGAEETPEWLMYYVINPNGKEGTIGFRKDSLGCFVTPRKDEDESKIYYDVWKENKTIQMRRGPKELNHPVYGDTLSSFPTMVDDICIEVQDAIDMLKSYRDIPEVAHLLEINGVEV